MNYNDERLESLPEIIKKLDQETDDRLWENPDDDFVRVLQEELEYYLKLSDSGELYVPKF